jgi:hypothetical protein
LEDVMQTNLNCQHALTTAATVTLHGAAPSDESQAAPASATALDLQASGHKPMTPKKRHAGLLTIAAALVFWVGTAVTPSETNAFQNWLGFVNCGAAQQAKLQQAGNFLSDRIYEEGGWRMYQCLDDAFLSNVNGHRTASEILDQLRAVLESM